MLSLIEGNRGCGRRKGGGFYLVAGAPAADCGRLPAPLELCPTCGEGIQFSMQPKWVDPFKLFGKITCGMVDPSPTGLTIPCMSCPLGVTTAWRRSLMV